jgi:vacuolar-type H+-ATPase subunit H
VTPEQKKALGFLLVLHESRGSLAGCVSFVQRKMNLGYDRAVDLIEELQELGHVTAKDEEGTRRLAPPSRNPLAVDHPPLPAVARRLDRAEAHDLGMIIKERTRYLETVVDQLAAERLADFETKMAQVYRWDQDDVWEKATREAAEVVRKAQEQIEKRCKELGIPAQFAPGLELQWRSRGQNLAKSRREELRRVARGQIEAMKQKALSEVRKQGLDLRTQVVTMSVVSGSAKLFLESLAPVEDAMHALDFKAVELAYLAEREGQRPAGYLGYDPDE